MPKQILAASPVLLLLVAATWAQAQSQVYKCGDTNLYTDRPCDDRSLVDLKKSDNILKPGPTVGPPPPPPETPIPPVIWPNASRVVSTPAAPPSNIWTQRDNRAVPPVAPSPPARPGYP